MLDPARGHGRVLRLRLAAEPARAGRHAGDHRWRRQPRGGALGDLRGPRLRGGGGDADGPGAAVVPAWPRRGGVGPQGTFVQPHHARYERISRAVMALFVSITPVVEPLSMDEAFLDVAGARRRLGAPTSIAQRIRDTIADEQGITCSVGIASTKFIAKLASGRAKPDGLLLVPEAEVVGFLHQLPTGALWGVGERTEEALGQLGLRTVADIAHTPVDTLRRALGDNAGAHLHALAWGRDTRAV